MVCWKCNGSGLVPLPRGMSPGFYRFMAAGCVRRDDGTLLMLCSCAHERDDKPPAPPAEGPRAGQGVAKS